MKRNCDRLLNIVKQITDIRHIDSGQLRLRFKEVDFINYSENIYSAFSANAKIKHISFISEHTDNVINIWLDPVHFEKIIVNLLSNAFKFTPEGGKIIVRSTICHNKKKQDGVQTENAFKKYLAESAEKIDGASEMLEYLKGKYLLAAA